MMVNDMRRGFALPERPKKADPDVGLTRVLYTRRLRTDAGPPGRWDHIITNGGEQVALSDSQMRSVVQHVYDQHGIAPAEAAHARDLAAAWDEGMRTGSSRAMRHMSDEPNLPLASAADNPYLTAQTELPQAAHARDLAALAQVQALGDGWVGFDDSHHYGDAILNAIGPESLTTDSLAALRERAEVAEAKVAAVKDAIAVAEQRQHPMDPRAALVYAHDLRAALADQPAGGEGR